MSNQNHIRQELNKLKKMPPWGRKQGDRWDKLSNFIYRTKTLDTLWARVVEVAQQEDFEPREFGAYAVRRWYNHHTHNQILHIILDHPHVQKEQDPKHRTIDFYLRGLPFDLKVSRLPQTYPQNLKYAWQHRHHLAGWLYGHQSGQGRYHTGNRLFLIVHNRQHPGLSWQLRREFDLLEQLVTKFLDAPTLLGLTITHQQTGKVYLPWSGVMFFVK